MNFEMNFLERLIILDIETVSCTPDFATLPDRLKPLWEKKALTLKNGEDLTAEEMFNSRAAIYAEFGKIITIAVGFFHLKEGNQWGLRVKSLASKDEAWLLREFISLLGRFKQPNPVLCAHNGKEFDFPYLCRRMLVNCIPVPEVLNMSGKKPWEVPHLDTMEMWKFGDRKSFTSLELLASIFGIESSKSDIDGSMVTEVFYRQDGLEKIETYCKQDVVVTAQLFLKLNCLPSLAEENIIIVD